MIVPHHVYLMLSDLVEAIKKEKAIAEKRSSDAALMDPDECAYWAAYCEGMGDALMMVKGMIDKI